MAHLTKLTADQVTTACAMRERGLSIGIIARKVSAKKSTLEYHFLRQGVDAPHLRSNTKPFTDKPFIRNGRPVVPFSAAEDAHLLQMQAENLGPREMSRRLGRYISSVRNRLMLLESRAMRLEAAEAH